MPVFQFWHSRKPTPNPRTPKVLSGATSETWIQKWQALVQYDNEIRAAAERLRPYGENWIDELGRAYFALGEDRKYLENIVIRLLAQVKDEKMRQWAGRFRITRDGEFCTELSLQILRQAEQHGYVLSVDSNGTIAAAKDASTRYLHSNSDIQKFGNYLS